MKLFHWLILAAVVVVGWLAWTRLPGLRTKVSGAVDEYGGWTEEARRDDPVGFLTYAEEKLASDIVAFRESREALARSKANAEAETEQNEALLAAADQLARRFRLAWRMAEAEGTWPVEIEGATYEREQLIEQVESLLSEGDSYERVLGIYADVIVAAENQRKELRDRIQATEATLVELAAQKELVRVQKLTSETDELLAQIDSLLAGNQETLTAMDEPVRSVEALLAASGEPAAGADAGTNALAFLEDE